MSKPQMDVTIENVSGQRVDLKAVIDSGSYYTIIRESSLPPGTPVLTYARPEQFKTAAHGGKLVVVAETGFVITMGDKVIRETALISPDLGRDLLIGAKTMQAWDITIQNRHGETKVIVGRDMRDPEITEVD